MTHKKYIQYIVHANRTLIQIAQIVPQTFFCIQPPNAPYYTGTVTTGITKVLKALALLPGLGSFFCMWFSSFTLRYLFAPSQFTFLIVVLISRLMFDIIVNYPLLKVALVHLSKCASLKDK